MHIGAEDLPRGQSLEIEAKVYSWGLQYVSTCIPHILRNSLGRMHAVATVQPSTEI